MTPFPLTIVTPDGVQFEGEAEQLIVRALSGDLGVMAGHENLVCPLGMGPASVLTGGTRRVAACIGGILSVLDGRVRLVPTTFEWAEKIDLTRAESAEKRAREMLQLAKNDQEKRLAEARLKRALVRQSAARSVKNI